MVDGAGPVETPRRRRRLTDQDGTPVVAVPGTDDAGMRLAGVRGARIEAFSATKAKDRLVLGEKVTEWLRENDMVGIHAEVRQSSDREFHCVSITVWAVPR
jgi:hypothetical protein